MVGLDLMEVRARHGGYDVVAKAHALARIRNKLWGLQFIQSRANKDKQRVRAETPILQPC